MKAYINEVHENYGCPPILNNCDDVLEFLFKTYKHPYCDEVFFQVGEHIYRYDIFKKTFEMIAEEYTLTVDLK